MYKEDNNLFKTIIMGIGSGRYIFKGNAFY